MPTNDNVFCTWRAQPYDIHLKERFLFFLCLFACFFLFCYLHFLVLFLVFWFISIFPSALCCPHFSIRIFPSASAIRRYPVLVLQTPQLDATTMFTYSHANTPLGQSERAYYLSNCQRGNRAKKRGWLGGRIITPRNVGKNSQILRNPLTFAFLTIFGCK